MQGLFRYRLRASELEPGGWRFDHDPRGSFVGADFRPGPATVEDFAERHGILSTSPSSPFVTTCSVQRRDARGVDKLTGCVLQRVAAKQPKPCILDSRSAWFAVLHEVFDLPLDDLDATERSALWTRVRAAHDAWLARTASALATSA